ncbi:hypothetical protein FGB62_71g26 [Gracilaria domingensis]|nr:hypothetical protein FGB62_71g26 [Gracilaria domingensis]
MHVPSVRPRSGRGRRAVANALSPNATPSVTPTSTPRNTPRGTPRNTPPDQVRPSDGPLSASTMAKIRCPTRLDFMNAVKCDDVRELHRSRMGRRHGALRAASRAIPKSPIFSMRMSKVSNDGSDSDDEGVPAYLNAAILDAMDRLEDCTELKAIVFWLDDLRARHQHHIRITDKDLSNGVALLDAIFIIDSSLFSHASPVRSSALGARRDVGVNRFVERELDEGGHAARRNMQLVRELLARYPWREECADDASIKVPNFEQIDDWSLANFVLLAAVTCEHCDELVGQMLSFDEWVQQRLSDVVARGMETLGLEAAVIPERTDQSDRVSELESLLSEERQRRLECEQQIDALTDALDGWRSTCEDLEEEVLTVNAKLDEALAEIRRLKIAGRSVLRDCDVRKRDSYNRQRRAVRRSGG